MFKFNFSIGEAEFDEDILHNYDDPGVDLHPPSDKPSKTANPLQPFAEIGLNQLLDALPSLLTYSPLPIHTSSDRDIRLVRRDLFDARFQLISESSDRDGEESAEREVDDGQDLSLDVSSALKFIDAPSDLVPGVYEGGLKTWECSLDLVDYLDSIQDDMDIRGKRVLEIGCGTGVPTLYLLHRIFSLPSDSGRLDRGKLRTYFHFQDYNSSVLQLITLPNIILVWYTSSAADSYRSSESCTDPASPDELPMTPELRDAFLSSLSSLQISLRFFYGSWDTFDLSRATADFGLDETTNPYDIVLTSETIYRTESLTSLVDLMKGTSMFRVLNQSLEDRALSQLSLSRKEGPISSQYLCLVAAKVLYFGVGGGISEFISAVERKGGDVEVVWERSTGVGRRVMRVKWD